MRSATHGEPIRRRLQHQSHRRAHRPQTADVVHGQDTRVEVRQQSRLGEHGLGRAAEVLECRLTPECSELFARHAIAELGLVAEREERLSATALGAGARDGDHLVDRHEGALAASRRPCERAVVTDIPAELRQRDEDLRRIGDEAAVARLTQRARFGAQLVEWRVEEGGVLHPASLRRVS